jgi:hypothetical protein
MLLNQVRSEKRARPCTRKPLFAFVLLSVLAITPSLALAQEQSFPLPATTGALGKRDAGALAEIKAHLMAVLVAGWQDLQATGTLTYPDGDVHSATLYLMGAKRARLDIEMAAGTRSVRLGGFAGRYQDEEGNQGSLPPATSSAGIVAFPRIWADGATSSRISLYDQNTYASDGQSFHRITMEYPLESTSGDRLGIKTAATDLYFDPNTHLLVYSVDAVTFNGSSGQILSRVTGYSGYQQFNGIKVPATIKQYLNGQLQWTLQLSQVNVNTAPPATTFSF